MQIRNEQAMKMVKERLPSCRRASMPTMLPKDTFSPAAGGGVCGSVKLYRPSRTLATAAVYRGKGVRSGSSSPENPPSTKPMKRPAAIQPTVPNTRMIGNCRSWLSMLWKASELAKASVGM